MALCDFLGSRLRVIRPPLRSQPPGTGNGGLGQALISASNPHCLSGTDMLTSTSADVREAVERKQLYSPRVAETSEGAVSFYVLVLDHLRWQLGFQRSLSQGRYPR